MTGEISALGENYVVNLTAVDCQTGDELAREQAEAQGKEQVLSALGDTVTRMRRELGESLASVERYDAPVEQATTSSLEALKAFDLGLQTRTSRSDLDALPFLERAVELDPNFAAAHSRLGTAYNNTGREELAMQHWTRAYELRDQVSELERLYIDTHYWSGLGNLPEQIEAYEIWKKTYPKDFTPYNNLANLYRPAGDLERSLEESLTAVELGPEHVLPYNNLIDSYIALGRVDAAEAVLGRAQERDLRHPVHGFYRYQIAMQRGLEDEVIESQLEAYAGTPYVGFAKGTHMQTVARRGRLNEARTLREEALAVLERFGFREVAAVRTAELAIIEAICGNGEEAIGRAQDALALSRNQDALYSAGMALALSGELDEALQISDEIDDGWPEDTLGQATSVPPIRAIVALERGKPETAIELLAAAEPYERWVPEVIYLRGQVLLSMQEGERAIVEFQKIADFPGVKSFSPVHAVARLGLARSYAMIGDNARALAYYEEFLESWQDADADIPLYQQAQAEYEALRTAPRG